MAMHVTILAIGKKGVGPLADLQHLYAARITSPLTIREIEEKRPSPTAAERIQREGNLLMQAIPKGAVMVALDGKGTEFTSEEFAQRLAKWRDAGVGELVFVIGGADGLAENVRAKANYVLSLGAMTWPHLLARGMLLEQLYRAQQIHAGHPYHRG
ncbi:MAG: 23S rRNA (pseudouridine(1915)-N(3))-methyltransferase RlmH [Stellaceae bacterium]